MSLKRANYLCGHQSCDNKKCTVRLSRELTRAACHVLERGFRDAKRKERLRALVSEAGDDEPDLPDLAALDLPLIEDSGTKISLAGVKLNDVEENKGYEARKRLKAQREKQQSRQSDGQFSKSSINSANVNRTSAFKKTDGNGESRSKSSARSTYGPGSNYMKYGGIDVHCKHASGKVNTTKNNTQRSAVEMKMAGSSKLTNVFGEAYGSTDREGSPARTDFLKYQKKSTPTKFDMNQMEEPIIIESHRRSSTSRPNPKSDSDSKPSGQSLSQQRSDPERVIPESMDDMKILFQFNSSTLTQPKLKVLDLLASNDKYSTSKGEITKETIAVQNKFPSLWDMSESEDSDSSYLDLQPRFGSRSQQNQAESPTHASGMSKNASHSRDMKREDLVMIPESSVESSDQEDTCVSRDLKKDSYSNSPKRMPGSYSARTPLAPVPEVRGTVGRNSSEVSTRHKCKISTLSRPQSTLKPEKPRTSGLSSNSLVNSCTASTASTASKSAADSTTRVLRSRTPSVSSKTAADSTSRVLRSRTPSSSSKTAADSTTGVLRSRSPSVSSKTAADSTTRVLRNRSPSVSPKTAVDSKTKMLKSRTGLAASTKSIKFAADPAVSFEKCRPPSAALNNIAGSKTDNAKTKLPIASSKLASDSTGRVVRSRTPSVTSKTSAVSNTKLAKSRQASTVSTQSKTAAVSATRVGKSRPASAASNSSNDRRVPTSRKPSTGSTKSKPDSDSSNKLAHVRATSAANQSKIPLPVSPDPKMKVSRPMNNVAAKVDCRRPMTAVVSKLSANVKLVEERSRPQTSGNEGGRFQTSSRPRLAVPTSEMKRDPIKLRLGSNMQCVGGENFKVTNEPGKLSASNKSSDANTTSPNRTAKKTSLPRSPLTSTTCNVRKISKSSINDIKEAVTGLVAKETNKPLADLAKPASKIPVAVNPGDSRRLSNLETNARENIPRPGTPTVKDTVQPVYEILRTLEDEMLSSAEKEAVLKMNKALIKSGKAKPLRAQRTTASKESKEKVSQEEAEQKESKKLLPPAQLSNANVRNKISLFDTLQVSTAPNDTRNVVQKDEQLEDDYALLMELANTKPCVKSQNFKNSLTESLMEFLLEDTKKVVRQSAISGDDEHSTESPEEKRKKVKNDPASSK